jgi:hypothetical protein
MHAAVRVIILSLWPQILRPQGKKQGVDLMPATDRREVVSALSELIGQVAPSAANVVSTDLDTVGVDLTKVPLDELLSFRTEHQNEYQRYARSVRSFVRQLSLIPTEDRPSAERDRRAEIEDLASDLKAAGRKAWKRPASFAIGAAGAAWTIFTGDVLGGLLGGGAALIGADADSTETGVFTYLFRADQQFR